MKNLEELTKNETAFLKELEIPCNRYGAYVFVSPDGSVSLDLQFILLEYKQWLNENKIVNQTTI